MTAWTREHLAHYSVSSVAHPPVIGADQTAKMIDGLDIWDLAPVRDIDGTVSEICGTSLWFGLSAPDVAGPALRHDHASWRLFAPTGDSTWTDLGPVFPPGTPHGSRQWAGAARFDAGRITFSYTAAGGTDPTTPRFRQRLFTASARLEVVDGAPTLVDWSAHTELFSPDQDRYDVADDDDGIPGFIRAFRDPFPFRDPATGVDYVLFTGSLPPTRSTSQFNGVIGIAVARDAGWRLLDPLVTADGVNNELERPHVVVHDGRYYLFFSTQARTFHPESPGPTGLFGFVADHLDGPYQPLNEHGVVFANPPSEPRQAYSWLVLNDLTVVSFIDAHGLSVQPNDPRDLDAIAEERAHFGGTIAPPLRITLEGDRAELVVPDRSG